VKEKLVKNLMVPLSAYATVAEDATLSDAVAALKESQANYNKVKYPHRAILVFDKNNDIVGKISMLSVLRGLEPKYEDMLSDKGPMHVGFTQHFQKIMIEQLKLWESPLAHICEKAARVKAKAFMQTPHENEYIEADATLDEAIHKLVIGWHQSLLVTKNKKVVGILRLTDVFEVIAQAVMACEI
jgi:CBS domain-containing protein